MANNHNISRDTLPHIQERRSLSWAYGEAVRMHMEQIVESRKEHARAVNYVKKLLSSIHDRRYEIQIYLEEINRGWEWWHVYSPISRTLRYIHEWKVTWEELKITENDFFLLVAKHFLADIKQWVYSNSYAWIAQRLLSQYVEDGKFAWADLEITKEDFQKLGEQK